MADFRIDIVLPVWNRPVETRSALVSLIACTPGARLILVDNGSDRETELILHEFAEGLAEGALLIRTERNEGLIPAINRGLLRCSAPFAAIVSPGTVVAEGWCEPLLSLMDEQPDLAAVLPPHASGHGKGRETLVRETTELSFGAMVLRRTAVASCGLFDPNLDGDHWCLREYAHRLHAGGWRLAISSGPAVAPVPPLLFGSETRRRALTESSRERVVSHWGEDADFCLQAAAATPLDLLHERMPAVLAAARQGHRLTLLLPAKVHDVLIRDCLPNHTNISLVRLSRFFPQRTTSAARASLAAGGRDPIIVNLGSDDIELGGSTPLTFERFAELVVQRQQRFSGR